MIPPRRACAEWPRILNPELGCLPPIAASRRSERTLHIALTTPEPDGGPNAISRALQSISTDYEEVYWPAIAYRVVDNPNMHHHVAQPFGEMPEDAPCTVKGALPAKYVNGVLMHPVANAPTTIVRTTAEPEILAAAARIRPTLVWAQFQSPDPISADGIDRLRAVCDPNVVICQWDGDQHWEPWQTERKWFVDLGQRCDTSLLANSLFQEAYARQGVRHPGYLQCGVDPAIFRPQPNPAARVPAIVLLANNHAYLNYVSRIQAIQTLSERYKDNFGVYGDNWGHVTLVSWMPPVSPYESAAVYSASRGALSISIRNDLNRYTSDRLFRALASGAVVLFERVPDYEGLGLVDGVNCLCWTGMGELMAVTEQAMNLSQTVSDSLRSEAVKLATTVHDWQTRIYELLAIVDAIREERRAC